MKYNILFRLFIYCLAVFAFTSCSQKLAMGSYTTTVGKRILFAGTEVDILPENKITIFHWTDSGNRYGEGRYNIRGNNLEIVFDSIDMIKAHYTSQPIEPAYADATTFLLTGGEELFGASIAIFDTQGGFIKGGVIDKNGKGALHVPSEVVYSFLMINQAGYEVMKVPITNQSSTHFNIVIRETITEFFKKGEKKTYKFKTKDNQLILKEGTYSFYLKEVK